MELKGSKTEKNLWYAFAGESQARNKYDYFASKAKKEGYEQIAAIFQETALNEKEHAKLWFKELGGIGDTPANLLAAAAGEHEEWTDMYRRFSEEAKAEGALALFGAKYGEQVSLYSIGEVSKEICCGPHVENTKELGSFKIQKEQSSSAGVRRIKAVIGNM